MRYASVVLFALVAATGIAAEGLHFTTSLDGMASPEVSFYLVPAMAFTVGPPQFQFGGELKLPVGSRGDKYLAAMFLLRFGPAHRDVGGGATGPMAIPLLLAAKFGYTELGVGVSTRLAGTADPSLAYGNAPQWFTCRLGGRWPIWTAGPGKLGLNYSLDWLLTEHRAATHPVPTGVAGVLWVFTYLPWYAIADAVAAGTKLSVGVNYTLDF
jgi:hypothetical protein